jgi:hypothetical protein
MSLLVALSTYQGWCELLTRVDENYVHGGKAATHSAHLRDTRIVTPSFCLH